MKKEKNSEFETYFREFRKLRRKGTKLFYPYDVESSPRKIAEAIVCDENATFMRDSEFDEEGKVVAVHFNRVRLKDP